MPAPRDRNLRFRPQVLQLEDRTQPAVSPSVLLDTGAYNLTSVGGETFFTASDGSGEIGLWKTDGTAAGTSLVEGGFTGISPISNLTNVDGTLFFVANDGSHGRQLWKSDGTTAGTERLTDLSPPSPPPPPPPGVVVVTPAIVVNEDDSGPRELVGMNGVLYFATGEQDHGFELWRSDGTAAGTSMVAALSPPGTLENFDGLVAANGELYFSANDGVHAIQLWRSDGTETGTSMITDINVGNGGLGPRDLMAAGGNVFFVGDDPTNGYQLWVSDGTTAGTRRVTDSSGAGFTGPLTFVAVNGDLYFVSSPFVTGANGVVTGVPPELWRTDGTAAGTVELASFSNRSGIEKLVNVNGTVFFTVNHEDATGTTTGFTLWKTDGTAAGTQTVRDFVSSDPGLVEAVGLDGALLFSVRDGAVRPASLATEQELWMSDGTAAGTHMVVDFNGGIDLYGGENVTENGVMVFSADDGTHGPQLWSMPVAPAAINLSPQTLPDTTAGLYSQQLTATGTTGAVTFTLAWGTLPPGLNLSAGGLLAGTPTQGGTFTFTVRVTDGSGATAVQSFTLTVSAPLLPPPSVPPVSPPPVVSPPVVSPPVAVGSGPGGGTVRVYDPSGDLRFTLQPFGPGFTGGVTVAVADVTGTGHAEIVVGAGAGGGPAVVVYDGTTGAEVERFFAFDPTFRGGVSVAAADVTGDGRADIVVGAGAGGGPAVAVFDPATGQAVERFFAFDPGFTGGVSVAVGDVTGAGHPEVVVGAGAGGGPAVVVYDAATGQPVERFFAFDEGFRGGVSVAVGDVTGAGTADLVVGAGPGGGPLVEVFDAAAGQVVGSFLAYDPGERDGVRVGVLDTGTGSATLVTADGTGRPAGPKAFGGKTLAPVTLPGAFTDLPVSGYSPPPVPVPPAENLPFSLTDPAWQTLPSGVRIWDVTPGTGATAQVGGTITVNYTGYLTDGTVIDSTATRNQPFSAALNPSSLIAGWVDGIPGMKPGGERRIDIPAALAYGNAGQGNIPPDAELVFDVTLLSDSAPVAPSPPPVPPVPVPPVENLPFSLTDPAWQTLPSGVRIWDVTPGTGATAQVGDTITVNFIGYLTDGTVFETRLDPNQPFSASMSTLIAGWVDGIPGMKAGGERRLDIPAALAYGTTGDGNIPPDAELVFDVTLLSASAPVAPSPPPVPPAENLPFSLTDPAWQTLPSGVRIWDVTPGTGATAQVGDTITVNYTGYLTDGTVIDSMATRNQPFSAALNPSSLIAGWVDGIPGMKPGGERRIDIPAALAYGNAGRGNTPPDAELVFDVTLLSDSGS